MVTRHDGAARPESLSSFPGPVLRHASVGDAECRTLGESIDLPRLDGQRDADAISPSGGFVMPLRLSAAASESDVAFPPK